jgi:hypothetical protein
VLFIDDDSRNTLSAEKHGVQTLLILLKDWNLKQYNFVYLFSCRDH